MATNQLWKVEVLPFVFDVKLGQVGVVSGSTGLGIYGTAVIRSGRGQRLGVRAKARG